MFLYARGSQPKVSWFTSGLIVGGGGALDVGDWGGVSQIGSQSETATGVSFLSRFLSLLQ